jgi:hypothetical protein
MLSTLPEKRSAQTPIARTIHPKRVRDVQRLVHLATAVVLVTYVYLTPPPGAAAALAVRWGALPILVLSGIALWKWPKLRRLWRQRRARA